MSNTPPSTPAAVDATVQASANQRAALLALRDAFEAETHLCVAAPLGQHVDETMHVTGPQGVKIFGQRFRAAELATDGEYTPLHAVGFAQGYYGGGGQQWDAVAVFQAILEQPALPARENEGQYRLRTWLNQLIEDRVMDYIQGVRPLFAGAKSHTRGLWHFRIMSGGDVTIGDRRIWLNPTAMMTYAPTDQTAEKDRQTVCRFLASCVTQARTDSSLAGYRGSLPEAITRRLLATTPGTDPARTPTISFPTSW